MKKILVVDDDPEILESLKLILGSEGFAVKTTVDGSEVVRIADEFLPDLMILDIFLGHYDGRDITKEFKSNSHSRTPIILISANPNIEKSALKSGATCFISKPFDLDELLECIQSNLSKRRTPKNVHAFLPISLIFSPLIVFLAEIF